MAPAIGPQCAARGSTQDPPKSAPKLGEAAGLSMLEGVRMEAVRMALTDQLTADGPSATLMPSKPSWQQDGFLQSPQPMRRDDGPGWSLTREHHQGFDFRAPGSHFIVRPHLASFPRPPLVLPEHHKGLHRLLWQMVTHTSSRCPGSSLTYMRS